MRERTILKNATHYTNSQQKIVPGSFRQSTDVTRTLTVVRPQKSIKKNQILAGSRYVVYVHVRYVVYGGGGILVVDLCPRASPLGRRLLQRRRGAWEVV
jgi:hypothetical protein